MNRNPNGDYAVNVDQVVEIFQRGIGDHNLLQFDVDPVNGSGKPINGNSFNSKAQALEQSRVLFSLKHASLKLNR